MTAAEVADIQVASVFCDFGRMPFCVSHSADGELVTTWY